MSEHQTKAGNQEFQSLDVIENCEKLKAENCNAFLTSSSAAAPSPVSL